MLSLLTGGVGKVVGIFMLIASLAGAVKAWEYQHDKRIIAEVAAAEQVKIAATIKADNARLSGALQDRTDALTMLAASQSTTREAIAHAKPSASCINSAPVRAALDGLRGGSRRH